jgi:hypothetical protein
MTPSEFVKSFTKRWHKEVGTEPTASDFAYNIPPGTSDSDAMTALVAFMEAAADANP